MRAINFLYFEYKSKKRFRESRMTKCCWSTLLACLRSYITPSNDIVRVEEDDLRCYSQCPHSPKRVRINPFPTKRLSGTLSMRQTI